MVLFSLILAVGMLVDDAIIVSEFAERRMSEGMAPREAYSLAARRMAGPVVAATATRVAAFSPLLFWPGVVGEFMKYMPITLIATLSASLVVALFFTPTLGAPSSRLIWFAGKLMSTSPDCVRKSNCSSSALAAISGSIRSSCFIAFIALVQTCRPPPTFFTRKVPR